MVLHTCLYFDWRTFVPDEDREGQSSKVVCHHRDITLGTSRPSGQFDGLVNLLPFLDQRIDHHPTSTALVATPLEHDGGTAIVMVRVRIKERQTSNTLVGKPRLIYDMYKGI